jgi:hypothetical protein
MHVFCMNHMLPTIFNIIALIHDMLIIIFASYACTAAGESYAHGLFSIYRHTHTKQYSKGLGTDKRPN